MEEIKNLILSPAFWIASVIVAFLMSFFSAYAKDYADKWFEKRSQEKDRKAKERQADFDAKVARLKSDHLALSLYQSNIIYQKLRQVLYYVASYVGMALFVYSLANFNYYAAGATLMFSAWMVLVPGRSVDKTLYDLRAVVNAALEDDDTHFVG